MTAILFNALFPVTWVLVISFVLLAGLCWLEIRRKQRFLTARLLAVIMAVFSLDCLILNPLLPVNKSSHIILLSKSFDKKVLDSLLNANPESQVYSLPGAEPANTGTELLNYRDLKNLQGNISLLGEGIPQYMLDYIDTSALQFFSSRLPAGFVTLEQRNIYTAHQEGELKGIFHSNNSYTIKLTGPGIVEDSVQVKNQNLQPFTVKFTPKTAGLYSYTLTATDSAGKIIATEQVPIQVKEQNSLSVLFLSDYPSAEIRFLKNFLEQQNHKLALRYKISKNKYRTEFVNTPQKNIGRLTAAMLQHYDLVLTDLTSMSSLSRAELHELQEAVTGGLGVLTLINTSSLPSLAGELINLKLSRIKSDSAQLLIHKQRVKLPATPVSVSSEKKLFEVQRDLSERIVSGYYQSGLGKSGFQLLTQTFSLQLAGEKEIYASVWATLVESVARKKTKTYDLSFITPFPYHEDEPVEFTIVAAGEKPTVTIDSANISITEDPFIKNVWYGKFWAGEPGWNSIRIAQDSSLHNFFVSAENGWTSLQVLNQQKNLQKISSKRNGYVEQKTYEPVSRLIFLLLFFISAGFLWLSPKL